MNEARRMPALPLFQEDGVIALVGCSKAKLPVPAPAELLYSSSPFFSMAYQEARRRAGRVFIVSGKLGLLRPEEWAFPYDHALQARDATAWLEGIQTTLPSYSKLLIFAQGLYAKMLLTLPRAETPLHGDLFQNAKALGTGSRMKSYFWPSNWLLQVVWSAGERGVSLAKIEELLAQNYTLNITRRLQADRVCKCCLHVLSDRRIYHKALFQGLPIKKGNEQHG